MYTLTAIEYLLLSLCFWEWVREISGGEVLEMKISHLCIKAMYWILRNCRLIIVIWRRLLFILLDNKGNCFLWRRIIYECVFVHLCCDVHSACRKQAQPWYCEQKARKVIELTSMPRQCCLHQWSSTLYNLEVMLLEWITSI